MTGIEAHLPPAGDATVHIDLRGHWFNPVQMQAGRNEPLLFQMKEVEVPCLIISKDSGFERLFPLQANTVIGRSTESGKKYRSVSDFTS